MRTLIGWLKPALIVLLTAVLPIGVLGYFAISSARQQVRAEQQRLVGLRYVAGLQRVAAAIEKHRTASVVLLSGDATFEPAVFVARDRVDDAVEEMNQLDTALALSPQTTARWHAIQNRWDHVKAVHSFRTPEESSELHSQLLGEMNDLAAAASERAQLSSMPDAERRYLADGLVRRLPAQADAVAQAEMAGIVAANRKGAGPERARLQGLGDALKSGAAGVKNDVEAALSRNDKIDGELETAAVTNVVACTGFADFLDGNVVRSESVAVPAVAVVAAARKPTESTGALLDAEYAAAVALTQGRLVQARRGLVHAGVLTGAALLLSLCGLMFVPRGSNRQARVLADTLQQVENGQREARVPVLGRAGLGRAAVTVNGLLDRSRALEATQAELEHLQAGEAHLLSQVQPAVQGDLTALPEVGSDAIAPLAGAFRSLQQQLGEMVRQVRHATTHTNLTAGQMESLNGQLVQASDWQASQAEQAALAAEALTTAAREASSRSALVAATAQRVVDGTGRGSGAVRQLTQSMDRVRDQILNASRQLERVGDGTRDVARLVRLIDDIAEWTGILSLNASLQVSAGGEVAHRFTAIAEVAARLATQANDAAKRLARLSSASEEVAKARTVLESTGREVVHCALAAAQAGQSLAEVDTATDRLNDLVRSSAGQAQEHVQASASLVRSLKDIGEAAGKAARAARQANDGLGDVARVAGELREAVAGYRLPAGADGQSGVLVLDHHDGDAATSAGQWSAVDPGRYNGQNSADATSITN